MAFAAAITGATATGKTALALDLALRLDGEIVSIDSRQVYRHIDIGTAKPSREEMAAIPHHMIDIIDLEETINAERFAAGAENAVRGILERGRFPILAGGSGMYLRALLEGFFRVDIDETARARFAAAVDGISSAELHRRLEDVDPASASRIHPNDRYRIVRALEVEAITGTPLSEHFERQEAGGRLSDLSVARIGLCLPRAELHRRINDRTRRMFSAGLLAEVARLVDAGIDPACPGMQTLGYPEAVACLRGRITEGEAIERVAARTRRYAKRQETWFRKEPGIEWLDAGRGDLGDAAESIIRDRAFPA